MKSMAKIRTLLAIAWFALAAILLVSSISDMSLRSWQVPWLVTEIGAALLASASALFLFSRMRSLRIVAIGGSVLFLLYWIYLFLISPPDGINRYSLTGGGTMLLAIVTLTVIASGKRQMD